MYRDLTRSKLQINLIASNPKEAREIAQLQESMKGWECVGCKLKKSLDKQKNVFYTLFVPDTVLGTGQQQLIGMKKMTTTTNSEQDELKVTINDSVDSLKESLEALELLKNCDFDHDEDSWFLKGGLFGIAQLLKSIAQNMEDCSDMRV